MRGCARSRAHPRISTGWYVSGCWDGRRREHVWSELGYTHGALRVGSEAQRVEVNVAIAELVYDRLLEHRML